MPWRGQFYFRELETLKHIIIEGRGFRGGSDEKIMRMWLGGEIVVAVQLSHMATVPLFHHKITKTIIYIKKKNTAQNSFKFLAGEF